jgi:hypothetical protein
VAKVKFIPSSASKLETKRENSIVGYDKQKPEQS